MSAGIAFQIQFLGSVYFWVNAVIGPSFHLVKSGRSDCCTVRATCLTGVVAAIGQLQGLVVLAPFDQPEKQRRGSLCDSSNWSIYSARP